MNTLRKLLFCVAAVLGLGVVSFAQLSVKQPCSDGMVLQQKTQAMVWGHADAGADVIVSPSWSKEKYKVTADSDGVWKVKIGTPAASYTSYVIKVISGKNSLIINDVLIGEVWFASGQSNMEMPLRGFHNCPVEGFQDEVCQAPARNKIRMYTERRRQSYEPVSEAEGFWRRADGENVAEMSATAYFFAKELNRILDVPVGIVANPYGGSRVESWLPKETLETYGTEDLSREAVEKMTQWVRPYLMYNAMLMPLKGYTIKGFIWYQGCSNVGKDEEFVPRMTELIRQWRSDFGDEGSVLPFYMVEIAPYLYSRNPQNQSGALLRQAQHKVAADVGNCACIVTNDLVYDYELRNIHPCRKQPVGQRLARLALNRDYGFSNVFCLYPHAVGLSSDGNGHVMIEFDNCPDGIGRMDGIRTLELRCGDGPWTECSSCGFDVGSRTMTIDVKDVPQVPDGKWQVRYGWGNFRPGNLFNNQGLPFVPFMISDEKF